MPPSIKPSATIVPPAATPTVTVFIVLADSPGEHKNQRLGMFFRVLDAEKFLSSLTPQLWSNPRIEVESMLADHVHPAHASLIK